MLPRFVRPSAHPGLNVECRKKDNEELCCNKRQMLTAVKTYQVVDMWHFRGQVDSDYRFWSFAIMNHQGKSNVSKKLELDKEACIVKIVIRVFLSELLSVMENVVFILTYNLL